VTSAWTIMVTGEAGRRLESRALEGHVMTKEIDMGIDRLEKIEEK